MSGDLLDGALPPITIDDQIRCVERELQMRRAVYPRLVTRGKMTEGQVAEEIRRMEAVLETLQSVKKRVVSPTKGEPHATQENIEAPDSQA